jgi:hypothetical protein
VKIIMKTVSLLFTASVVLSSLSNVIAAEQAMHLTPAASIEIANSKGKFDFLRIDSKRGRLLAAHENDGTSDFIDLRKNALITRVKVGGPVDTAVDNDSKFYYVSVQEPQRIAVLDAETLKEVKSIKTPGPTDAIIYEPKNHMVYVTHDNGGDVWVIDPASAKVVGTIAIPGVPEFMVYDEKIGPNLSEHQNEGHDRGHRSGKQHSHGPMAYCTGAPAPWLGPRCRQSPDLRRGG